MSQFDPIAYTRAPNFDVAGGYATGVALLAAIPKGQPRESRILPAGRKLRAAVLALREQWTKSAKVGGVDRRSFDALSDASFRALGWSLDAVALVTGTDEDDD